MTCSVVSGEYSGPDDAGTGAAWFICLEMSKADVGRTRRFVSI